jgi:hypothetical protein
LTQALEDCIWLEPGGTEAALTIGRFLDSIGISIVVGQWSASSILPGLTVTKGVVMVNPEVAGYPGDLLHDAGHLAVTQPDVRADLDEVSNDPGEEMAAIAWSVAAAKACGISLEVLFHPAGYKGGSPGLISDWTAGQPFGVPLLGWYGMTSADEFPAMRRWLR